MEGPWAVSGWGCGEVLVLDVVVVVAGKLSHIGRAFGKHRGVRVGDA